MIDPTGIFALGFTMLTSTFLTAEERAFSREHEAEADETGISIVGRACFDPAAGASAMGNAARSTASSRPGRESAARLIASHGCAERAGCSTPSGTKGSGTRVGSTRTQRRLTASARSRGTRRTLLARRPAAQTCAARPRRASGWRWDGEVRVSLLRLGPLRRLTLDAARAGHRD
eukprot:5773887-Prymnesium_polylepis.1